MDSSNAIDEAVNSTIDSVADKAREAVTAEDQDDGEIAASTQNETDASDFTTRRSSLQRQKVLNIGSFEKRGLGMVAEFGFAEKILGKMPSKELGILLSCLLPLVKVEENRYLFGVEARNIIVKKDRILIQGGASGFMEFREYISRFALSHCLVLWRMMKQKNLTYREAILQLLKLKGAKPKTIAKYDKELQTDTSDLFQRIALEIKKREASGELAKEYSRKKSKNAIAK